MLQWVFIGVLGVAALSIAAGNWQLLYHKALAARRGGEVARSFIPFLGGVFGVGVLAMLPMEIPAWLYVVPLLADFGSLPYLAAGLFAVAVQRCRKNQA
jgi:hypothetical protein